MLDIVFDAHRRLPAAQRRCLAFGVGVDPDDDRLAALDASQSLPVRLDQLALHVSLLDGRNGSSTRQYALKLRLGRGLELLAFTRNFLRAIEDIAVGQKIGFER